MTYGKDQYVSSFLDDTEHLSEGTNIVHGDSLRIAIFRIGNHIAHNLSLVSLWFTIDTPARRKEMNKWTYHLQASLQGQPNLIVDLARYSLDPATTSQTSIFFLGSNESAFRPQPCRWWGKKRDKMKASKEHDVGPRMLHRSGTCSHSPMLMRTNSRPKAPTIH